MAFIRSRIHGLQNGMVDKDVTVQKEARSLLVAENKIRVYAILIDLGLSNELFIASDSLKSDIIRQAQIPSLTLPYICEASAYSAPVVIEKMALMVLKDNPGSQSLLNDVTHGEIKYVIISQDVFMINHIPSLRDDLIVPYFQQRNNNAIADALSDKHVYILYSLANHKVTELIENESCRFEMQPFIGSIKKKVGSSALIDLRVDVLGGSSAGAASYPIHIIGYQA